MVTLTAAVQELQAAMSVLAGLLLQQSASEGAGDRASGGASDSAEPPVAETNPYPAYMSYKSDEPGLTDETGEPAAPGELRERKGLGAGDWGLGKRQNDVLSVNPPEDWEGLGDSSIHSGQAGESGRRGETLEEFAHTSHRSNQLHQFHLAMESGMRTDTPVGDEPPPYAEFSGVPGDNASTERLAEAIARLADAILNGGGRSGSALHPGEAQGGLNGLLQSARVSARPDGYN
jgi:hypothetical protein